MRRNARLFIVCSPSPRVGVTTTARLLTDYYLFVGGKVEGFDTDPHDQRYAELFPDIVRSVDASDIKGQIALFDRLLAHDETTRIVDVWRRVFPQFFSTVREIGFIEEARQRGIELVVLFHPDASQASLRAAAMLRDSWPGLEMILVQNEGANPLGPDAAELLRRFPASGKFVVPALQDPVAKILDQKSLSLSRFLRAPPSDMSIVVRAALKSWVAPIFTQFQSFELRRDLESSDVFG
jgi:hypothetical protein